MTGKRLRKLRLARELTTDKAARMAGVARRTWVRWEASPRIPEIAAKLIGCLWAEEAK